MKPGFMRIKFSEILLFLLTSTQGNEAGPGLLFPSVTALGAAI